MATVQIRLSGNLKQYGARYDINADTPAEAMNCLYCQLDGFKQKIMNGWFRVRINRNNINSDNLKSAMHAKLTDNTVIHITPKTAGAKNGGVFNIIAGAALVVVGVIGNIYGGWGTPFIAAGMGMMVGGVAQMLTRTPKSNNNVDENGRKSTSFSNLENTAAQGSVMPVPCGRIMVGSRVMSQGVETQDVENEDHKEGFLPDKPEGHING